ncbi:MAG: DNA primase [Candidatus Omnitrophota bacterium]|nr:DNA primase [Candidatus Omnitrophota bacterium]
MISNPALQEIQDRLNIVEVIGATLSLKKAGRNFKGLCPFHSEKTPSFMIYPEKQFFICYGCGAAGDLISFVMKHEKLEFPEAVEVLARKAGVPVPQFGSRGVSSGKEAQLVRVHEWAAGIYRELLVGSPEAKGARAYLEKRGLEPSAWETFQLGYAPDRWDHLSRSAEKEGFAPELLEQAGLSIRKEGGGSYDRFRNRLIFPIWDARGRVIAFSGRLIEEDPKSPKYLNSPETELYVKGKVLYGLHLAAPHIREQDFCIVVEGNMDLVTPISRGVRNVVASMGTALTEAQVKLIRRHTRHVVMVYDGDEAGQAATLRGLDLFLQAEMRVRVAVLPAGTDPDSLIRKQGVEAFAQVLKECKELFDYKLGGLTRQWNPKELEGRIGICREMLPTIKRVPNAIQKGEYIRQLAEVLGIGEALLWKEMERVKLQSSDWKPEGWLESPPPQKSVPLSAEEVVAGLLLEDPSRAGQLEGRIGPEDCRDPAVRQVVERLMAGCREGNLPADPKELWKQFQRAPGEWEGRMARWLAEADTIEDKDRALDGLVQRIQANRRQESVEGLRVSLRKSEELGNDGETVRLIAEINRLVKL